MASFSPSVHITEIDGRVRLGLEGFTYVEGETLQEAADELVARMLHIAMAIRAGGVGPLYSECCPDAALLDFVWQLGEHAADGGDPRDLLFGPNPHPFQSASTRGFSRLPRHRLTWKPGTSQVTLAESRPRYVSPDLEFAVWAATIGESPEREPVTLAGPLGHVTAGEQLVCNGAFSRHPRYVVAGARTRAWLTQAEAWLLENQRLFAAVSLLVFGAVLAADGIVRLL